LLCHDADRYKEEEKMPPYDCMLLFKPNVKKEALIGLVSRIGKHVCKRNGVVTAVKSFGTTQLGYGVRKRDGRFYQVRVSHSLFSPVTYFAKLTVGLKFYIL